MNTTDTSEKGLESLIVDSLVNDSGYTLGNPNDYDQEYAVDYIQLVEFLRNTQKKTLYQLGIEGDDYERNNFLHRLCEQISKRGVVDVLRNGIQYNQHSIILFYGTPSPENLKIAEKFSENIFSITRQLRYSTKQTSLALDMAVFINGLPVATFELKNSLTKQTADDAIRQYQRDRDAKELLFQFKRCAVHFAVDDLEVYMCTRIKGEDSWFLPFNKGHNDGAGNPPNPNGIATDYLWKEILSKETFIDILENYAQSVEEKNSKTGKKTYKQIFPRYHQLKVVRLLLSHVADNGLGKRYLIQHSAGSGKSNSIAWLAHQLVGLRHRNKTLFDSIIVVTDRRVLDKQIRDTIKQFSQVGAIVGHAESAKELGKFLEDGKKIIITTVQKFPFILGAIGQSYQDNKFAIIIDEAHSSQGGKSTTAMNRTLQQDKENEEETTEDKINRIMEERKMLTNASYFAFTATPKNKTLEIFGTPDRQSDGKVKHRVFHSYTMKQAIEEGFILDVLESYTTVSSYYRLIKTVIDDPTFDTGKAQKKLRGYVENHEHAIRQKTEIMVDHFQVKVAGKIGRKARAMVVTGGINRAIQYFNAFKHYLAEIKSPYKPVVAFSGEHNYHSSSVTETSLNDFPSSQIPEKIQQDPFRFLIVAEKYQTGYDEPLLHTMYVDKILSGIKAVQTLSRLNRAHPQKNDTFILDFSNDSAAIQEAFEPYYRTTILSEKTDPNKLHDLKSDLDSHQVYSQMQIDELVDLYLGNAARDTLDPILDICVNSYKENLNEDNQIDFKSKAKAFIRTYGFLAAILPYSNREWEKLYIFMNFLIPKLPTPIEEDLSKGILKAIDMESYRAEVFSTQSISIADKDAEIDPVPSEGTGGQREAELDQLSNIVKSFNDLSGDIAWKDKDKIFRVITEEIPAKMRQDRKYQNAIKNNDEKTARIEHDAALEQVILYWLNDNTELYKQFSDNPAFSKWLKNTIFDSTYRSANPNKAEL